MFYNCVRIITAQLSNMFIIAVDFSDVITVTCSEAGWGIDVDIFRLRQYYPGAEASDIYLGENSCTGNEYYGGVEFRQGLRDCLTNQMVNVIDIKPEHVCIT